MPSDLAIAVRRLIRTKLDADKISLRELCQTAGVSHTPISRFMTNPDKEITTGTLVKIASALGCDVLIVKKTSKTTSG